VLYCVHLLFRYKTQVRQNLVVWLEFVVSFIYICVYDFSYMTEVIAPLKIYIRYRSDKSQLCNVLCKAWSDSYKDT
jgi:hypothetical protein